MSKRWVKLSRGVLLGTLMIMGSAQAEEPPKPAEVPAVVESIIDEAINPIPAGVVAEADQPSDPEQQIRDEAAEAVDLILPETGQLAQEEKPAAKPATGETAQEQPPKTEGADKAEGEACGPEVPAGCPGDQGNCTETECPLSAAVAEARRTSASAR